MRFQDDGGTPAYRVRQQALRNTLPARIKRLSFVQIVLVCLLLSVAPWGVLIAGLALLGLKDALF